MKRTRDESCDDIAEQLEPESDSEDTTNSVAKVLKHGLFGKNIADSLRMALISTLYHEITDQKPEDAPSSELTDLYHMVKHLKINEGNAYFVMQGPVLGISALKYFMKHKMIDDINTLSLDFKPCNTNIFSVDVESNEIARIANLNQSFELLSKNTTITEFSMRKCILGTSSIYKTRFMTWGNVTDMQFISVSFTPSAVMFLTNYLSSNPCLTRLSIINEPNKDNKIAGDMLGTSLSLALGVNTVLQKLSFNFCDTHDNWPHNLALALTRNSTLKSLDLSNNKLTFEMLDKITGSLSGNQGITHLSLSNCAAKRGYTLKALADALAKNTILSSLDLRANKLNTKAINSLSAILTHNSSLRSLDVSDNKRITDTAAQKLTDLEHLLISSKLLSLIVDDGSFTCSDDDDNRYFIMDFLNNRSMWNLSLVRCSYVSRNNLNPLMEIGRDRYTRLESLKSRFLEAVASEIYNFTDIDRRRLFYFEEVLLSQLETADAKKKLWSYNRFGSSHTQLSAWLEGDSNVLETEEQATKRLNDSVTKYQDYVENSYELIRDTNFRDVL